MKRWLLVMTGCVIAGLSVAEPEAVEESQSTADELLQKLQAWASEDRETQPTEEEYMAFIGDLTKDLDVSGMSVSELSELAFLLSASESGREKLERRLGEIENGGGTEAVEAAVLHLMLSIRDGEDAVVERTRTVLGHADLSTALKAGKGYGIFAILGFLPTTLLEEHTETILGLADDLSPTADAEDYGQLAGYIAALGKLGDRVSAEQHGEIEEKVSAVLSKARESAEDSGDAATVATLDQVSESIKSAAAQRNLINSAAPEVNIEWVSDGGTEKTLADFKGKVVVIDFWATWCGPCVASFPKIRELRAKYPGDKVEILGVTSLQGNHYVRGKPPVDTSGDPDEEYRLMSEYVKDMDITWTVAFSRQNVFNPDFGVQGIPHLAILGKDGTVRHNGLSPHGDLTEKYEIIDKLLAEPGES